MTANRQLYPAWLQVELAKDTKDSIKMAMSLANHDGVVDTIGGGGPREPLTAELRFKSAAGRDAFIKETGFYIRVIEPVDLASLSYIRQQIVSALHDYRRANFRLSTVIARYQSRLDMDVFAKGYPQILSFDEHVAEVGDWSEGLIRDVDKLLATNKYPWPTASVPKIHRHFGAKLETIEVAGKYGFIPVDTSGGNYALQYATEEFSQDGKTHLGTHVYTVTYGSDAQIDGDPLSPFWKAGRIWYSATVPEDIVGSPLVENPMTLEEAIKKSLELIDPRGAFRQFQVGDRVELTDTVDNYPTGIWNAGERGTVASVEDDSLWVTLDKQYEVLDEWNNQLQIYETHADCVKRIQ